MSSLEDLERAIYQMSQRDAALLLLSPRLITAAFITNNVQLTPQALEQIKSLLRAMANDPQHNPITLRDRIMADITHDLSFLSLRAAIALNEDPTKLMAYLVHRYPMAHEFFTTLTLKEMTRFQSQLAATIEAEGKQ